MSQGHPAFPQRNAFASSTKLPDRTAFNTTTQQSFSQSTFGRRPDPSYPPSSQAPNAPQYAPAQGAVRQSIEKDGNVLAELTSEQRDECQEAFNLFDLDRDKYLNYHELRVSLRALGFELDKSDLAHILRAHGVVMPEFAAKLQNSEKYHVSQLQMSQAAFMRVAGERILNRNPQLEIERAFQMFDQDRKGYIVLEDLRRVSRDLGESGLEEDELNAMVNEFDYDGTGAVAKEAFYAICMQ